MRDPLYIMVGRVEESRLCVDRIQSILIKTELGEVCGEITVSIRVDVIISSSAHTSRPSVSAIVRWLLRNTHTHTGINKCAEITNHHTPCSRIRSHPLPHHRCPIQTPFGSLRCCTRNVLFARSRVSKNIVSSWWCFVCVFRLLL